MVSTTDQGTNKTLTANRDPGNNKLEEYEES